MIVQVYDSADKGNGFPPRIRLAVINPLGLQDAVDTPGYRIFKRITAFRHADSDVSAMKHVDM
jgi:hypothetical protein